MIKKLTYTALCLLAAVSCSIKENRLPCPCYLEFEPEEGVAVVPDSFSFLAYDIKSETHEQRNEITWQSVIDDTHMTTVRKSVKLLVSLEGQNTNRIEGRSIMIPEGEQCDSLRIWSEEVDCTFETAIMPIQKTKHFATVTMELEAGDEAAYPYGIRVRSNIAGINMETLEPIEGAFVYEPVPSGQKKNIFVFRLPRQNDASFHIELIERQSNSVKATIPLGTLVELSGYDWSEQCLKDINIGLNYAIAGIHIVVNDWETIFIEEEI